MAASQALNRFLACARETVPPPPTVEDSTNGRSDTYACVDRFDAETGRADLPDWWGPGWRNRLIWGDNRLVLSSLLDEFAGKVDLIYIDPPFATGADFSYSARVGDEGVTKLPSMMEEVAYRDMWKEGVHSYVGWICPILAMMVDLMGPQGAIYIHCDSRLSHYLKLATESLLGERNFRNEISWMRAASVAKGSQHGAKQWGKNSDSILFFTKGDRHQLLVTEDLVDEAEIERKFPNVTEDGRRYNTATPVFSSKSMGARPNLCFEWRGFTNPHPSGWRLSRQRLEEEYEAGRIVINGDRIERRTFLEDYDGVPLGDLWSDKRLVLGSASRERTGYPTQKPESLLERIIRASSMPGDLVLDCFVGSGTTAAVAEKLGRRWIAVDIGRFAVQTTRKRLLDIAECRPFEVQNLGLYERRHWQTSEFNAGGADGDSVAEYYRFVLELYDARVQLGQFAQIHGIKEGRAVHVGATDAPVTQAEIDAVTADCEVNGFNELDVLGWEFEMGINADYPDVQQAGLSDVKVRKFRIPREILDSREVEAGGINFFELSVAHGSVNNGGDGTVSVELTDFLPRVDEYMMESLKDREPVNWSDWIDYWSVDFEFDGSVFVNQWQAYRTQRNRELVLVSDPHRYESPGRKLIVVKVIDIFGNDTTLSLEHEV